MPPIHISEGFDKSVRLLKSSDFQKFKNGSQKIITTHFVILYKDEHLKCSRLGFSFSKKSGNAVLRNRFKREIREWFRKSPLKYKGVDLFFIPRLKAFKSFNNVHEFKSAFLQSFQILEKKLV